MKEKSLPSLTGIPFLLGLFALFAVAIWLFVTGVQRTPSLACLMCCAWCPASSCSS